MGAVVNLLQRLRAGRWLHENPPLPPIAHPLDETAEAVVGAVVATAGAFPSVGTVPAGALETPGAAPVVNAEEEPVEPVGLAETVLVGSPRVVSAVESVMDDVDAAAFDGPSPPAGRSSTPHRC